MSSLVDRLYPLPDRRRTPLSLLRWWESRRLLFNGIVGGTGLVTLGGVWLVSALPPVSEPVPLAFMATGAAIYGLLANVCYTLGWWTEMLARWAWGRQAPDLGPVLFRQGLIFSVGLTLLPLIFISLAWVASVVLWVFS
jgi:hypothetical protein